MPEAVTTSIDWLTFYDGDLYLSAVAYVMKKQCRFCEARPNVLQHSLLSLLSRDGLLARNPAMSMAAARACSSRPVTILHRNCHGTEPRNSSYINGRTSYDETADCQ